MDRIYKEENMKCIICRGSNIIPKTVDEEIRKGNDIILIPLDIIVCSNCGERYYNKKAINRIEEIRSKIENQEVEVEEIGKVMRANAE